MLRYNESMDERFRAYEQLGRDNLICISGIRRWCKNAEVEPTAWGLAAESTGLPIGSHALSCPHVSRRVESMNVRGIVSDFLVEHCAGCPHHSPNGDASWGRKIIDEHIAQTERAKRLADERALRVQELRAELRNRSADLANQSNIEARSILRYLESVFSEREEERCDASERIQQAALLGADALPLEAMRLIAALARTPEFAESMLPVCTVLGSARPDARADLVEASLSNFETLLHVESSAAVLQAVSESDLYPLDEIHIKSLILSQDHSPFGPAIYAEGPRYPHSTAVLVASFDADPESVNKVVREQLESKFDRYRHSTCGAIELIQKERPRIALDLLESLVASLNLHDEGDESMYGPSTKIVSILRGALFHSPIVVDQTLAKAFANARPAVQGDILKVYRPPRRSVDEDGQPHPPELADALIQRLLGWIQNERLPVDVRNEALNSLGPVFRQFPSEATDKHETLLGYLAVISTQEEPPDHSPLLEIPGRNKNPVIDQLDRRTDRIKWNTFKRELAECLSILGRHDAPKILNAITDCLDQPLDQINPEFKTLCLRILGEVASKYDIRPQAVPYLWRALMDFSSPSTRAEAIEATVKLFRNGVAPPPDLVEMVLVYLTDEYVAVHQAALRAVTQRRYWFDSSRTYALLVGLRAQLNAYSRETYQLDDICDAILRVCQSEPRWKVAAIGLIETVFPTGEDLVDQNIAHRLIRFSEPVESVAVPIAKLVTIHLGRHERDRLGNSFGPSEREEMIGWLRGLPIDVFQQVTDDLMTCALKVAEQDPWEACFLAGVFGCFLDFRREREVLDAVLGAIPEEPRMEDQRRLVLRLRDAAARNAAFQA